MLHAANHNSKYQGSAPCRVGGTLASIKNRHSAGHCCQVRHGDPPWLPPPGKYQASAQSFGVRHRPGKPQQAVDRQHTTRPTAPQVITPAMSADPSSG